MRCVAVLERDDDDDMEIGFEADRFDVHPHGLAVTAFDGEFMSVLIPMHRLLYIAQSLDETDDARDIPAKPEEYEN